MPFDVLIKGGTVVDGTGAPGRIADVAIRGQRIVAVGKLPTRDAKRSVDARGLHVCPGFINIHSHLDFSILNDPGMEASVRQGITFELGGQCGASVAPGHEANPNLVKDYYRYFWHGHGLEWNWVTLQDFFGRLESKGISVNFGMQIGHTNLRLLTIGDACRPASSKEIEQLQNELAKSMLHGSFGLSSGLQWAPGFFATTAELISLGQVLRKHGGFYSSHMRSEGDQLLAAIKEVIDIGEHAGIPVIVSHLKASGRSNFGKVHDALRMIAAARTRGVEAYADTQPYGNLNRELAAEHMMLRSCIPPWVIADAGGGLALRSKLKDTEFRRKLKQDLLEKRSPEWNRHIVDSIFNAVGWSNLVLGRTENKAFKKYEGSSIESIAAELAIDPFDLYFDILADDEIPSGALFFMMDPEDVRTVVKDPFTMLEVDGSPRSCHPRLFGCFPRFLDDYVRIRRDLTLEEAIRKITSFPASVIGLQDRGIISEGHYADLTLLDWRTMKDKSSFEESGQHPSGIPCVYVNGEEVVRDGKHTGVRSGMVIRNNPGRRP